MKRTILKCTAIALCLLLALSQFSASALESGDWSYEELTDGSVRITRYLGDGGDVAIPAELEGKPVTAVGDGAFAGLPGVASVTVPDGVQTVGEEAFADCPELAAVTLPDSVTSIGRRAFRYCQKLQSVRLPATLSELPYQGFWDCQGLEAVVVPTGVSVIPNGCFYNCLALKEITLPASVTAFEKNAFHACLRLEELTLGADVSAIDPSAFSDCEWLVIHAPEESYAEQFAKDNGFVPETALYETPHPYTDSATLTHVAASGTVAQKVTFSAHTYVNGMFGFDEIVVQDAEGNEFVYTGDALAGKTLVLGGDRFTVTLNAIFAEANTTDFGFRITKIEALGEEEYAAYLADLDANPWLAHVVNGTLEITGYQGLQKEVTVPAKINNISVTSIGKSAFANNRILTRVTIEDGVHSIGENAFEKCTALEQLQIPESVTEIGASSFFCCTSLQTLSLPSGVAEVSDYLAGGCMSLNELSLPQNLKTIGESAFNGCASLKEIQIPAGVTQIGESAFEESGLETLSLPEGLTAVPDKLCQSCEALSEVSLASTVTEIGKYAFSGCSALKTLTLPAGIKAIGNNALSFTGIETVTLPEGLESIGNVAFNGSALTAVHIPSTVSTIGTNPFAFCRSLTEITAAPENPYFSAAENCLLDKSGKTLLSCPAGDTGTIEVPQGVTAIGREAFSGASLTAIIIPETVTEIGIGAFTQCIDLKHLEILAPIEKVPESCFMMCKALDELYLPQTLTTVDKMAFYECTALKAVHYIGEDWSKVSIGAGNDKLNAAAVHTLEKRSTEPSATESGHKDGLYCTECQTFICRGTEIPPVSGIPGDISGDGEVNAKDITILRRVIAGGYGVSVSDASADVNHDGYVNAKDVTFLRRALAGGYGVVLN